MKQASIAQIQIDRHEGVYVPAADSRLLMETFNDLGPQAPAFVLDVCCGSGVQGIAAAMSGHEVVAIDSQPEAVAAARANAKANGVKLATATGDLFEPVRGWRFDALLANPPYVPVPPGGELAPWCDGGFDGRSVIDRICIESASVLRPGGKLWLVQSSLADIDKSLELLFTAGFDPQIAATAQLALGPVSRARIDHLVAGGHIQPGDEEETLAVICARLA